MNSWWIMPIPAFTASRGGKFTFWPFKIDLAAVRGHHAAEHLHERGFAGSVFPDDGMDPALVDVHRNTIQGHSCRLKDLYN